MGAVSRNVVPACGSLCYFCPALKPRSRQPVKRYKKLLADIFPKYPDEEVNDWKINKLCEYATKNPLRIPKITTFLEQRCYKELRTEQFQSLKVVRCIYRKLLISCSKQIKKFKKGKENFLQHAKLLIAYTVSVVLENYGGDKKDTEVLVDDKQHTQNSFVPEGSPSPDAMVRVTSWRRIVTEKGELLVSLEDAKSPRFWSRMCLNNMAKFAKKATTVRRVLESLFRYFDNSNLRSPECGFALPVLGDMQSQMKVSGQNTQFRLSILIKHLDHKKVLKKPNMQLDIVNVASVLAQQTKVQASVAIIGSLSDMMRHLRKSIHCSLDDSNLGVEVIQWNRKYQAAVDGCLVQLTHKIGDAGPILDMMAVMLENMSNITVMCRTLISAVYHTGQIVATIPNFSYQNKAFPEALFLQLLQAMVCADYESSVGAHRIFSVVLVPASVCPQPGTNIRYAKRANNIQKTLSRAVSVFSSSVALFEKLNKDQCSSQETICEDPKAKSLDDEDAKINNQSSLSGEGHPSPTITDGEGVKIKIPPC